ncbi:MAG: hypothetical protein WCI11_05760 [Candidatus Methylumidiphilus sp.]
MTTLSWAVEEEFQRNIDSIATQLIGSFSLKFKQEVSNLSSPLLRWLDFRYRYIDPQPRQVIFSNKFPKKQLPTKDQMALNNFVQLIKKGRDVNPYQGRGLTLKYDISGERKEVRTDLMWADWGIHHFHLSDEPIPSDQYYSRGADFLVFCLVGGDLVAFIDVLPHPDKEGFANPELINTVASNWPDYIKQYRLNGIMPGRSYTQAEIHTLRSSGIQPSLNIGGYAYISPGQGISSAATPTKISIAHDHVRKFASGLAQLVSEPDGLFRTNGIAELKVPPNFSLVPTPRGLSVYELNTRHAFLLPSPQLNRKGSPMEIFHDLALPSWACRQLITQSQHTPLVK